MAYKIFHIGKANQKIDELEAALTAKTEEAKAATENSSEIVASAEKMQADLAQANSDLATAKTSIASLTERAEKAELALREAEDKLANPSMLIKLSAARQALDITAAQGQPPVVSSGAPIGKSDILAEHDAIKDPTERTAWYRKNKAAYDSAHKAKNPGDMKLGLSGTK